MCLKEEGRTKVVQIMVKKQKWPCQFEWQKHISADTNLSYILTRLIFLQCFEPLNMLKNETFVFSFHKFCFSLQFQVLFPLFKMDFFLCRSLVL